MLKKILKYNKISLILFIVLVLIVSICVIIIKHYKGKTTDELIETSENYNTVIAKNREKNGKFVYVEIVDVPYLVAIETVDSYKYEYYVVYDENNYMYIAKLKKATYEKICEEYEKNPDNFSYLIMGRISEIPEELQNLIIQEFNKSSQDVTINKFNYYKYFGTSYLDDSALTPYQTAIWTSIFLILLSGSVSIVYLIFIIKGILDTKKSFNYVDKNDLKEELSQKDLCEYKKAKIILLDKYFVSINMGMIAHRYCDIAWVYIAHNANAIPATNMRVYLKNGYKYTTKGVKIKDEKIYSDIIVELEKKNPNIMIGYTFENLNKYNKIKNQNKNI